MAAAREDSEGRAPRGAPAAQLAWVEAALEAALPSVAGPGPLKQAGPEGELAGNPQASPSNTSQNNTSPGNTAAEVPTRLAEALRYALLGPGKRLRPLLVLQACEALGGNAAAARAPAVAIECLHTYSLVHDDLPSMDDDDLRRGRPTCHVVFGEALAILVGDALQTMAFEQLGQAGPRAGEMVVELARAAGAAGMVGGQVLDIFPSDRGPGLVGLRRMHQLKTGRLFEAALVLGALAADPERRAPAEQVPAARAYGRALGRLFQAIDDVLDVTGSAADLGKTPGKDQQHGRDNLVELLGLAGARAEAAAAAAEAEARARSLCGDRPGPLLDLPGALLERTR